MHLLISIDRADGRPLQVQIYESIRTLILNGTLKAGKQLPSSRSLSEQLGIARNTVVLAYERLAAEDYINSRMKAGIFINDKLPDAAVLVGSGHSTFTSKGRRVRLGKNPTFTGRAPMLWMEERARPRFDFFVGRPHAKSFPTTFWRSATARHLAFAHGTPTQYGDPRGLSALREAIADHLRTTRGMEADADQVLITSGIQGALNLLARIFVNGPGETGVAVENPCYQGAAFLFSSYGANIHPVRVDDHGLIVSQLEGFLGSLVYVTPSHQFPTGCTLSLERRLRLLSWAYQTGSYIIEDDYDSDFRYDGPPLAALAGLDRRGHVIYLGTFSKSIGAGIRIGYAVLPRHLLDQAWIAKALLDHGAPWLEQAVVADFLKEGAFIRHLRRIRRSYMAARDALVDAIEHQFPGGVLSGRECGMHVMWTLPPNLPTASELHSLALSRGVGLYPLSKAAAHEYGKAQLRDRALVLGYTALSEGEIRDAIARVAVAIKNHAS